MPGSCFSWRLAAFAFFFSCRNVDGLSTRASTFAPAELTDDLLTRFIVVPEHNLLFCYMEKVGSKNFNELFRRLRTRYDPKQAESYCWWKNTPTVHNLTKDDLAKMLVNKTWHKAVFYREPVERFVSAYASKCGHADDDGRKHCREQFGQEKLSFGEAVAWIHDHDAQQPDDHGFNMHFVRMSRFCGGLNATLQHYNTVEELDIDTANKKVSKLLKAVGVDPKSIEGFDDLFPPDGGKDALKDSKHITDTEDRMLEYFPPGVLGQSRRQVLTKHYKGDYELFGIGMSDGMSFMTRLAKKLHWPLLSLPV